MFYQDRGINRFHSKAASGTTENEHSFDSCIQPSRLNDNIDDSNSVVALTYSNYQAPLSLWKTMMDELRVVPMAEGSDGQVLIGLGCMAWSGGMLNASPFCLWRETSSTSES